MDGLIVLGVVVAISWVVTPILAIVCLNKIGDLQKKVGLLEKRLIEQSQAVIELQEGFDEQSNQIFAQQKAAQMAPTESYTLTEGVNVERAHEISGLASEPVSEGITACALEIADDVVMTQKQVSEELYQVQEPLVLSAQEHILQEETLEVQDAVSIPALQQVDVSGEITQMQESDELVARQHQVEQTAVQSQSVAQEASIKEVHEALEMDATAEEFSVHQPHAQTQNVKRPTIAEHAAGLQRKALPVRSGPSFSVLDKVKEWFTTGNVPVKIGILVLLAGVASLLKYVTDQGWIYFSMQARLACISAGAIAAFGFAWRKRETHRTFSLSLQGGAIGILLLTIFAAFRLYSIIPAGLAFGITVALIVFMGLIAVRQNAMMLAIFTVLAGFMAPIWLSTGSGNYVALFSYYAVLNAGIFGMAWFRPWRYLNLLGFAFTFGIATAWGVGAYTPEKFVTTEPFLLLFFVFYLLIPIFYARKYQGSLRNVVDAALVLGTPLVAFSLQAALLQNDRYTLAGCAFGLGLIYFVLRYVLGSKERVRELTPAYLALGMGFVTLAVPLAFSAQQTSCIYALEGVALVWWGVRQAKVLSRLSGIGLQVLSAFAFTFTLGSFTSAVTDLPIVNASFINMMVMAGAAIFSAWSYRKPLQKHSWVDGFLARFGVSAIPTAAIFYLWGLMWWCIAGAREIYEFADVLSQADYAIIFVVLTAWLAAEGNRKWPAQLLNLTTAAGLCLPLIFIFWQNALHGTPLMDVGWLAWCTYIVLGVRSIVLWRSEAKSEVVKASALATQFLWWPTLTLVAAFALKWFVHEQGLSSDFALVLPVLPMFSVIVLSLWRWPVIRLPLGEMFDAAKGGLQSLYFGTGLLLWLLAMQLPANNFSLSWLPFLNPIEFLQLVFAFMLWIWLKRENALLSLSKTTQSVTLVAMGLLMLSVTTLRAVHHWGDVAWNADIITNTLALRYLGMVWCIVTIALAWHGIRRKVVGLQELCLVLQAAAAIAFMKSGKLSGMEAWPIFNLDYLGMFALSLAGLVSAWWYLYYGILQVQAERRKALAFYVWGLFWLGCSTLYEAQQFAADYFYGIVIGVTGVMAWLASRVYRSKPEYKQVALPITVAVAMGAGVLLTLWQADHNEHLFVLSGFIGWSIFAVSIWLAIAGVRAHQKRADKIAQLGWWGWLALSASVELGWVCVNILQLGHDNGWTQGAIVSPWLLLIVAVMWRWQWVRRPLGESLDICRQKVQEVLLVAGSMIWTGALFLPSNTAPMPWVPVLNPIDLLQLLFAFMMFYGLLRVESLFEKSLTKHSKMLLCSIMGFALTTVMVLRGVHHWGDVAWNMQIISNSLTQTSLSILWSVLGVGAWIWGSRKEQRLVWWGGAILMAVVLAKLLLVDRQDLGNVLGIVSFIGYGLLCVVVGYFAPAPPRDALEHKKQIINNES